MQEEEIKDKYPEASLHKIDTNRICLTPGQLEMIFNIIRNLMMLSSNYARMDSRRMEKAQISITKANLIDKSMKETNKSKVKHVTFKEDYDEKDEYT